MSRRRPSATDAGSALAVAGLVLVLAGCGDEDPEVPAAAVSDANRVVGGGARGALALGSADLERLATAANVDHDVLASTAGSLTGNEVWNRAMDGVRTIYADAPEGVERTLVDVACRSGTGRVHTDYQLHYAIFPRVNGFNTAEIDALTETAFGLFTTVHDARDSDRDEDRAAAVLTCHTLEALLE